MNKVGNNCTLEKCGEIFMKKISLIIVMCFLLNMAVFTGLVQDMAANLETPGMMPLKVLLILCAVEALVFVTLYAIGFVKLWKAGKGPKESLTERVKKESQQIMLLIVAIAVYICAATVYLRIVPSGAVTMMADMNRMDLFNVTNGDSVTMMAYYMKALTGISPANMVCIIIPIFFYIPVVCALWEVASALYVEDAYKRNFCFLCEAILVLFGNCMYSMTGLVNSGLIDLTNICLVVSLLLSFALCFRMYHTEDKKEMICQCLVELVVLVCVYLMDVVAFVLSAMTVLIFGLLLIGRRYLPWLKSSN